MCLKCCLRARSMLCPASLSARLQHTSNSMTGSLLSSPSMNDKSKRHRIFSPRPYPQLVQPSATTIPPLPVSVFAVGESRPLPFSSASLVSFPSFLLFEDSRPSFEALPDLCHAIIASCLSARSLDQLAACAKWLCQNPIFCPSSRTLLSREDLKKAGQQDNLWWPKWAGRSSLLSLLARGGGGSEDLTVMHPSLMDPFVEALRVGSGSRVLTLTFDNTADDVSYGVEEGRLLGTAMGSGVLPVLSKLCIKDDVDGDWRPVWNALAAEACPSFRSLEVHGCSPGVLEAMRIAFGRTTATARSGAWSGLKELYLRGSFECDCWELNEELTLLFLLNFPFETLEVIDLGNDPDDAFLNEDGVAAVANLMNRTGAAALRKLVLGCPGDFDSVINGDCVAMALASGAAPSLEVLSMSYLSWKATGVKALAAAVTDKGALGRLRDWNMAPDLIDPVDLTPLMRAIASSKHGCHSLSSISMLEVSSLASAMAEALRGVGGLPSLTSLELQPVDLEGLKQLTTALQGRPPHVAPLQELKISYAQPEGSLTMGRPGMRALLPVLRSASVKAIKTLDISSCELTGKAMNLLARALGQGEVGAQLRTLRLKSTSVGARAIVKVFDALADGPSACPFLQALELSSEGRVPLLSVDAVETLLSGRAACSASLSVLELDRVRISASDFTRIARALATPSAVRLKTINLCSRGTSVEGVMNLISALKGPVGDSLTSLRIRVEASPNNQVELVTDVLVDALRAGTMGQLTDATVIDQSWAAVGYHKISKILEQRRQARRG